MEFCKLLATMLVLVLSSSAIAAGGSEYTQKKSKKLNLEVQIKERKGFLRISSRKKMARRIRMCAERWLKK